MIQLQAFMLKVAKRPLWLPVKSEQSLCQHCFQMGGCQNYGPLLGPLNTRCRIILRSQTGTINLTSTQMWLATLFCEHLPAARPPIFQSYFQSLYDLEHIPLLRTFGISGDGGSLELLLHVCLGEAMEALAPGLLLSSAPGF